MNIFKESNQGVKAVDIKKIKELIKLLEDNQLSKLAIRKKDEEIILEKQRGAIQAPMPSAPPAPSSKESHTPSESGEFITSPMVGTYYSRPAPDQQQFVKAGDVVEEKTVVCIIEAMKVMNEVKANKKGMIKRVLVQEGQPVEFGTKLFEIG